MTAIYLHNLLFVARSTARRRSSDGDDDAGAVGHRAGGQSDGASVPAPEPTSGHARSRTMHCGRGTKSYAVPQPIFFSSKKHALYALLVPSETAVYIFEPPGEHVDRRQRIFRAGSAAVRRYLTHPPAAAAAVPSPCRPGRRSSARNSGLTSRLPG